jgi:hypothetical protein
MVEVEGRRREGRERGRRRDAKLVGELAPPIVFNSPTLLSFGRDF